MKKQTLIAPYKLCKAYVGPHEYFAYFHWYNRSTRKYQREKIRVDLREMDPARKLIALQKIADKFNKVLTKRNNQGLFHDSFVKAAIERKDYEVAEALVLVAESGDKKLSAERIKTLKETANNLLAFQKASTGFQTVRIHELSELFMEQFIEWCYKVKRAGKSINKYLTTIQFVTQWMKRKELIDKSFDTIPYRVLQPKNESGRFPPLTHDEKVRAFSFFVHKHPHYNLYLFCLYYTCIRGAELYRLQRKDIDFEAKTIHLSWYSQKSGMKNGLSKFVQLLQPLMDLMLEMGVDKLPEDYYLFGTNFRPSKTKYKEQGTQSSEVWAYYRKQISMPKEKQAYGLKHTFNVDYVENNKRNIDWEWLRRHNRHAIKEQTQEYISGLTAYFLDESTNIILNYKN